MIFGLVTLAAISVTRLGILTYGAMTYRRPPRRAPTARLTVLVPLFNEERVIQGTVESLLRTAGVRPPLSPHPSSGFELEILLIDDGSTDASPQIIGELAKVHPQVRALILPQNRGKAEALNAGLEQVTSEYTACIDADTVIRPSTLPRLLGTLEETPSMSAACANIRVGNERHPFTALQSVEYITAQGLERRAQDALNCITTLPGACTVYRTAPLRDVGGWSPRTLTEDTDLSLAFLQSRLQTCFVDDALAFTEAPQSLSGLWRQRRRWLRGYHQNLRFHFFPSLRVGGILRWFGMPNLLWVHVLSFLVPVYLAATALETQALFWDAFWPLLYGLSILEVLLAAWSLSVEGVSLLRLPIVLVQRALWIPFLQTLFVLTIFSAPKTRGRWKPVQRVGELASRAHAINDE